MNSQPPGLWHDTELPFESDADSSQTTAGESSGGDADEQAAHQAAQTEAATPEVSETPVDTASSATKANGGMKQENAAKKSKSQWVREYLEAHPEARNRDIADALKAHGVKPADVANVKSQLKGRPKTFSNSSDPSTAKNAESQRSTRKVAKKQSPKKKGRRAASAANYEGSDNLLMPRTPRKADSNVEIGLADVDAAIQFIEQAGGIDRARQIIDLVDRIRQVPI